MLSRQIWEIGGVFVIAAALHVSAAALFLPDRSPAAGPANASPVPFSAGSQQHSEMIERWESSPEIAETAELEQPDDLPEPEVAQPEPPEPPVELAALPAAPPAPDSSPAMPNLPEAPEPHPVDPELPELQNFAPPVIESELLLTASERPQLRPSRPKPEPVTRKAEPQPQKQAPSQQSQAPAKQRAQQPSRAAPSGGGQAAPASQTVSASQRASLQAKWGAQLSACIASGARRANVRGSGRLTVNVTIGGNGTIRGVSLAASSGRSDVDRAALQAIRRVGRCPAAPAALNVTTITAPMPVQVGR